MIDRTFFRLPDSAQNFAADALLARRPAGHHSLSRGQDTDPETALYLGDFIFARVSSRARAGNPLDLRDYGGVFARIFQVDLDDLFHALFGDLEISDVALFLENAGDFGLQLRSRNVDLRMARHHGVAHPGQHICYWITSHSCPYLLRLPACFHYARNLAAQRQLAEAQPADPVLAE